MKQNHLNRLFSLVALLIAALLLCSAAQAAEPVSIPERGILLPFTEEDTAMGLSAGYVMGSSAEVAEIPMLVIAYNDEAGMLASMEKYTDVDLNDPANTELAYEAIMELYSHSYTLFQVGLFESEYYDTLTKQGRDYVTLFGEDNAFVMGENGGYTYVAICVAGNHQIESPELKGRIDACTVRAGEVLRAAAYQEIVFAPGEFAASADALPAFSTADLNGSPVDSSILAGKDVTVVNVWATWCNPCVSEMPELQAWSASMPENVQLIGLCADLSTLEDAETLETAKMICEATGVTYPCLVVNEDFAGLLSTVVGFPTTFFVDSQGNFIADPIIGVNVEGCKAVVEAYLNAQ